MGLGSYQLFSACLLGRAPLIVPSMRHITLPALKVALADLFDKRIDALLSSNAGKTYEPILRDKKARIDALPEALTGGRPLAEALSETDDLHDAFGAAIWSLTEAYFYWPDIPADVRSAIERIREAFIPDVDLLRAPYIEEVDAAVKHKADLVTFESDLKSIPIAGGLSLYDWCAGFVAKGEALGELLSQRADMTSTSRVEAGKLRAAAIGALGRLRAALADEMSVNDKLPADLDAKIFGYFDELDKMGANAAAARRKPAAQVPDAPELPTT